MSEYLALRMNLADAPHLGCLRQKPGIEICQREDQLWLRTRKVPEELEVIFRTLPGTRFTVLSDGQLVQFGKLVPQGHLPDAPWIGLLQWMRVELGSAALGGSVLEKTGLRLVRGGSASEPNVLLMSASVWQEYAECAPQVRLDRWSFALSSDSQVILRGTPLPPVPGVRFVQHCGVAVEAGWTWAPAVDPELLSHILGLPAGDLAVCHADGTWDHIQADDFVRATHSAVRLSLKENTDD